MVSSLDGFSEVIRQQGALQRAKEEVVLNDAIARLPQFAESLAGYTNDLLLRQWYHHKQASYSWMQLHRMRALHRLCAYLCRKEILRRMEKLGG